MDGFFGIGFGELVLIAIVALIVLGPERLPGAFREVAKFIRMLRNLSREFTDQFGDEFRALEDLDPRRMLQEAINDIDEEEKAKEESTKPPSKKTTPKTTKPAVNKTVTTKTAASTKTASTKTATTKDTKTDAKAEQTDNKTGAKDPATKTTPTAADQNTTQADIETTSTIDKEQSAVVEPLEEHQILPPASSEQTSSSVVAGDAKKDAPVNNGIVAEPARNDGEVTDKEHIAYTNGHIETSPAADAAEPHPEPYVTAVAQPQKPETTANMNTDSPAGATIGEDEAPAIGTSVQDEEKQS